MGKTVTDLAILHEMVADGSRHEVKTVAEYVKQFDISPVRARRILWESHQYRFKKVGDKYDKD